MTFWTNGAILLLTVKQREREMKTLKEQAAELAFQILKEAELDDDSEQGVITVDPNLLFQFYILANTKERA